MDSIKYLDTMGIEALFSVAKGKDRLILFCLYDLGCRVGSWSPPGSRISISRTDFSGFRAAGP
jgi:hypothetical protein